MCSQMGINKERILIFEKQLDRINRIVRIERPSAEGRGGMMEDRFARTREDGRGAKKDRRRKSEIRGLG